MGTRLSVQSYCFRGTKDNAAVAGMVRTCGLSAIELCGVHVDFQAPATFAAAVRTYRDAGVAIVSAGVSRITGDAAKDRPLFDFVQAAGARCMSVDFLLHLKDFVFDRARTPEDVIVGTGNLALGAVAAALARAGFAGEAVLEYEGDVADPVPALTECVTAIRREMDVA